MRRVACIVSIAAAAGCGGGSASHDSGPDGPGGDAGGERVLPPADAPFDYQLGGAYPPPAGVQVVSRDRTEAPAAGLYGICYVNGFQTQPGEADFWLAEHPDLILRDDAGDPVIDPDWPDEMLLDVTTADKRAAIAGIVGGWIDGCAAAGYQAVEIDNLDTFSRSGGRISADDAVATAALFAGRAHAASLAIAQKNSAEIVDRRGEMGFDFAVAEECNRWDECAVYTGGYGDLVFVIEYDDASFQQGCQDFPQLSIVRRDLLLTTPSGGSYVFDGC
jgi:hypothetical protein